MIKSWTLKNFKSVKDLNKLDFAPLTIFAGANSSGKSTILQSILLTAQTLQNSVSTKSIILNGHILKFGAFNDILSNGSNERIIDIGFEAEPMIRSNDPEVTGYPRYFFRRDGEIKNIFCSFSFSDTINGTTTELFQLHPKLEKSTIKAILSNNRIEEVEAVRSNKTIEDRVKELKLNTDEILPTDMQTLEYEVKKPSYFKANPIYYLGRDITSGRYVGAFLSHFLPRILTIVYDEIEQEKESFLNILSNKEQYNNGQKIFDKYINDTIINSLKQLMKEIQDEVQNPSQQRLFEIKNVLTSVERLFNEFNYSNYLRVSRTTIFGRNFFQKVDEKRSEFKLKIKKTEHSDFRLTSTFNYAVFSPFKPISLGSEDNDKG